MNCERGNIMLNGKEMMTYDQTDLERRISALEESVELRDIYNLPQWIKFMELIKTAKSTHAKQILHSWAVSHHQLGPILSRFHQCTSRFGLTFDIFVFVPPSRLIFEQNCRSALLIHQQKSLEHQQKAGYYEDILRGLPSAHHNLSTVWETGSTDEDSVRSCWSVLSELNPQAQTLASIASGESPEWDVALPFVPSAGLQDRIPFHLPPPARMSFSDEEDV